jgi:phosphotriesterase-related protein
MKRAMSVLGPVAADQLGHILPHEHILQEFPDFGMKKIYPEILNQKVNSEILDKVNRDIWSCIDNTRLDDAQLAMEEITSFKHMGGGTIVDVTSVGMKRQVNTVAEIARQTGVNIVAGTGCYLQITHPAWVSTQTIQELADWMVGELTTGIERTDFRAGIIGEIGISSPMHPNEAKMLQASALAHHRTGAPISIHQYGGKELVEIDALLKKAGVSPDVVIMDHMGSIGREQRLWVAGQGYNVELDCFGNEYHIAGKIFKDEDRVARVQHLIDHGFLRQIVISNDVALKNLLKKYGGRSYENIITHARPILIQNGIPANQVDAIIFENPNRIIAYLD